MKNMRIKVLDLGFLCCKKSTMVDTEVDEKIKSPVTAILIQHPKLGNIVYDTGNDIDWELTYSSYIKKVYPPKQVISIYSALEKEGLRPEDIDYLIISHMHFDHIGGLKYFKNSVRLKQIIVAGEELNVAISELCKNDTIESESAYIEELYKDIDRSAYTQIEDNYQMSDDIELFLQECHTPAVIGLIIRLQKFGTIIFTSDAIYTRESFDFARSPNGGVGGDKQSFLKNLEKVKKLKYKENAYLYFGHDIQQKEEWVKKGWVE